MFCANRNLSLRRCVFIGSVLLLGSALTARAIEVAGTLFVDLDAMSYNSGDSLWTNSGTGYTDFEVMGAPQRVSIESTPGILFNGSTDAFVGQDLRRTD